MASNVSGIQPIGMFQYVPPYSDYDYIDMDASTFPFSMDNSVFGAGVPLIGGFDCGSIGGGMIGGNQSWFDNMRQQQQFYNQYYVDQQKMNRNADLQINGAMEAVRETAENLKDKIKQNEQDQIKAAYEKYIEAVRNAYGNGSDEEINSRAMSMYQRLNGGKGLVEELRENSHSSFLQGFLQSITMGAYYRKSAEDNIAEITGQEVAEGRKTGQNVGRAAGVATVGIGTFAIINSISSKLAKAAGKTPKSGKAALLGLIAAGASAVMTCLTGRLSTK